MIIFKSVIILMQIFTGLNLSDYPSHGGAPSLVSPNPQTFNLAYGARLPDITSFISKFSYLTCYIIFAQAM